MFIYQGKNRVIFDACERAELMLFSVLFYVELRGCKNFTHSNIDNPAVIDLLNKHKFDNVYIEVYKPLWRWSKAIAYYTPSKPFTINLNYYQIKKKDTNSIVGTIFHEYVHLVDGFYPQYSFGHKTNNKHKYNNIMSAPYQIGSAAKRYSTRVFE